MISTKGRYAIRMMIDLAQQPAEEKVTLEDVAARQGISKKYLEVVARLLVRSKLVKGVSGKGGGYMLMRKPEEYTIWEILENTEENMAVVACLGKDATPCERKGECLTLPLWAKFDGILRDYFGGITLKDVIDGKI